MKLNRRDLGTLNIKLLGLYEDERLEGNDRTFVSAARRIVERLQDEQS